MALPETQFGEAPRTSGPGGAVSAVLRFLRTVAQIPAVERVAVSDRQDVVDVWVLLERYDREAANQILAAQEAYLDTPDAFPLDLHVVPLDLVRAESLPPLETVFPPR